jgi:hypothetical protein
LGYNVINMTRISWFNTFISGICLFLMLTMGTSALVSSNSSMRYIDGRLGLLVQPIGENITWLGNQVKKGIIPMESISVQAQQAVSVVFSIEEVLQQLIASVVQSILNTVVALISQVLNFLKDGLKQIGDVFSKVKEIGAGLVNSLQALTAIKDLFPQLSNATYSIIPTPGKAQNAVYTGLTNFTTCENLRQTQLDLPPNERTNVPSQETCDNLKFNTTAVAVSASCGELRGIPLSDLLGVPNACPSEVAAAVDTAANTIVKDAKKKTDAKIKNNIDKAPDGCKFALSTDKNAFTTLAVSTASAGVGAISGVLGQSSTTTPVDFSNASLSFASGESTLNIPDAKVTVPSPKECEFWRSGDLVTIASGLSADKSVPSVKDGGLAAVFSNFLQQITKMVTDFVNEVVQFAVNLVNQFVSAITSIAGGIPVLGQYISSITGGLSSNSTQLRNASTFGNAAYVGNCIAEPCPFS